MKFRMLLAVILATVSAASEAQSVVRPRIVVAISVDQFSADLFTEYRQLFKAGLHRLQTGVVFPGGYQSHAATETCPGHSTILTGSRPARTGIIANEWYDQSLSRADKKVYCSEDPSQPGSSSANYTVSAQFLKAQTLGDRMKAANPGSRVVSVAGKDRAAIMMGGHAMDQVWFWSGKSFVTLKGMDQPTPRIVEKVNASVAVAIGKPDRPVLPEQCRVRSVPVAVAGKTVGVPHDRKAGDFQSFRTSLAFDRATTDIAIGLIRELHLGASEAADVLSIGLSATDYVGHTFGTEGAEMCAQLLGVDENVGRILAALDATRQPYAVVLTADHGGHDLPERNKIHGFLDAARVDAALLPANMSKQLAAEFNLPEPVLLGVAPFGDIYLARGISDNLRPRVLEAAKARYLAHPQVAAVYTPVELRRLPFPSGPADEWSLAERFRASFDPERSGDLIVAPKPHITPIIDVSTYVATHGSPWNYDRRVPILFYRPGVAGFEQALPIETVDILPTLAALIELPVPSAEIDGRCIDLDAGAADSCAFERH
ncbi:MAG: type phosphodiesterase/nucleotide pyrophosphatase [Gammaproteobacteria bacterium]|nr:type phosphodiesterase/nucleotide pyrophosphatase [Gammaproteobacteria bacterium]